MLNLDEDEQVRKTAVQILILQQFDDEILDFNISQVAAVAVILAINIVKMSE
jgi:hypothetical protein